MVGVAAGRRVNFLKRRRLEQCWPNGQSVSSRGCATQKITGTSMQNAIANTVQPVSCTLLNAEVRLDDRVAPRIVEATPMLCQKMENVSPVGGSR